jgi:hypothetical protein
MTEAECRMTKASTATHALDWGAYTSRVLVVTSRDDELFSLSRYSSEVRAVETTAPAPGTGALPGRSLPLRCDAVGQRVGMKIDVVTQTVPGTIWLGCLRDAVLFTCREVVPRIVTSDGEKCPAGALQMLH